MRGGPISDTIGATSSLLEAVCGNLILWLETEAEVLGKIPADINAARQELEALIALREGLAAEIDAFSERLAAISNQKASGLHQQLAEMVQSSIAEFLAASEDDGLAARASKIDARLRLKLESVFLAGVEDVSKLIAEEQERLRTAFATLLEASRLREKPAIIVGRPLAVSPSLAALSEPAALGLGASLGEFAAPAEGESDYLSRVILSDFEPIMEKLTGEAASCFHESSANLAHQVKALTLSPLDMTIERISAAIREAVAPAAGGTTISQSMEQNVHAIRETISGLQLVLARGEPSFPPKSG
jgi:hypothetical protein